MSTTALFRILCIATAAALIVCLAHWEAVTGPGEASTRGPAHPVAAWPWDK